MSERPGVPAEFERALELLGQMALALTSEDSARRQIVVPTATAREEPSRVSEASEGLLVLDDDLRVVGLNEAALRMFGVTREDALYQDVTALLAGPDGEPPLRVSAGRGRRALVVSPFVAGRRAGGRFALEIRTTELSFAGASRHCLLVSDLSERRRLEAPTRQAEARYRALVEAIPAVTFMAALDGGDNEMYVSPQIESLLGFSQKEWLDDPILWFKQLHPDDQALWNEEFARGIATGGPFRAECRVLTRDGRVVWIHGEARLVRDDAGRPLFLQGIAFDITESKRAIEQIKEAQEAKIRTERLAAVGQLAASIGHDIRNPLGAVTNAFYYIAKKVRASPLAGEPRIAQFIGIVEKELKAATGIVSDLLDFARERPPALVACPLAPLVDDAFSVVPRPANVRLANEVPDTLPVPDLDKDQFRQVVVNLVQNAAEAIPAGRPGLVRVGGAAEGGEIVLTVADDGEGIPDEIVGKIFEPLFTSKVKGTGLGLSIVANTVKRHRGSVTVQSARGVGTTFTVRLPLGLRAAVAAGRP
ncbi:MAG TPA: ATP-binding protein [Polyangiaceae bacterium]|nr:ATP-binding protein [Polyangiaceae bacterium]